jgi:hypothetical protein
MSEISENLSLSWNFMTKIFDDIGRLILLIILNILPIVNFIVMGYGVRIVREGDNIDEPPPLEDYGELFIDGLKVIVAIIIYSILPALIFVITALVVGLGWPLFPRLAVGPFNFIRILYMDHRMLLGSILALIVAFIIFIFGAMGIIHMIKTDDLSKLFAFSEIKGLIDSVGWGRYLLWLLIMYIIDMILISIAAGNIIVSAIFGVFFTVFLARSAHLIYPH